MWNQMNPLGLNEPSQSMKLICEQDKHSPKASPRDIMQRFRTWLSCAFLVGSKIMGFKVFVKHLQWEQRAFLFNYMQFAAVILSLVLTSKLSIVQGWHIPVLCGEEDWPPAIVLFTVLELARHHPSSSGVNHRLVTEMWLFCLSRSVVGWGEEPTW